MIIIQVTKGLGNQMFQYALYHKFKKIGKNVCLKLAYDENELKDTGDSSVFDVYPADHVFASSEDLKQFPSGKNIRCYFNWFGRNQYICEKEYGKFHGWILNLDHAFLDGYWQTEKYFDDCRDELKKIFTPVKEVSEECKCMSEKISKETNAVSIHIRLGDYTTQVNRKIYGDICTKMYYQKAMEYFEKKYNAPAFYLFSNDLRNAKFMLGDHKAEFVDCNNSSNGWADIFLMSKCRHNIIANSTFSWWGAWLNENSGKEVVAPARWIHQAEMPDICPGSWIRMEG